MKYDDDLFSDFDPYQHLMELTMVVEQITKNHNNMVEDYEKCLKRVRRLELQMHEMRTRLLSS